METYREEIKCDRCGAKDADVKVNDGFKIAFCRQCGKRVYSGPINKSNIVSCPFCHSTDCKKIPASAKIGKTLMWGVLAAGTVSKTWHCNKCGSNFG